MTSRRLVKTPVTQNTTLAINYQLAKKDSDVARGTSTNDGIIVHLQIVHKKRTDVVDAVASTAQDSCKKTCAMRQLCQLMDACSPT